MLMLVAIASFTAYLCLLYERSTIYPFHGRHFSHCFFCNSEKNNAAINILYMPFNIPKYALIQSTAPVVESWVTGQDPVQFY